MNGDSDARITELERQIESLKALLDDEIVRAAKERMTNIDRWVEHLDIIKGLINDSFGKDISLAQKHIQINRDDLNRSIRDIRPY